MVNTDLYLALGLGVVLFILGGYGLSLVLRFRQMLKTISTLETLKDEG